MRLHEIIGQKEAKSTFFKMAKTARVPHAMLLLGAEGTGGLPMALGMAQLLLCDNLKNEDACGECAHCAKVSKLIHPDLHFTFPTTGSKAISEEFMSQWRIALAENPYLNVFEWLQKIGGEGKQGNITAAECNQVIKKLSLKTFEGKYKIQIIWLPEYLGKEGNRLLKMIEEPPEKTVFILVAEDPEAILNTILSRCQMIKLNKLSDIDVTNALLKKNDLSDDKARSIAYLADGDFNEALQILDVSKNAEQENRSELFLDWLRKCYKGDGVAIAKWVEQFASAGRENQKYFLRYGLHFMREYLDLKMLGKEQVRLMNEEFNTAKRMLQVLEFEQVEKINKLFSDCAYFVERNANPKILFLDASIQLNRILKQSA